jgi:plasmid maintenance system antidote protein VapI
MSAQLAIPVPLNPDEVTRKKTLGSAIELCAHVGGFDLDKQLQQLLEVDKAQFSRWLSGAEGIVWPKLTRLMDTCGNDAPMLWMAYDRGFDLHSLRRRESETERENRQLREEVAALRRVLMGGATDA